MSHDAGMHRIAEAADAGAALFLRDHHFMSEGAAAAAIFLRDGSAENARLTGLQPGIAIDAALVVPLLDMRHEFSFVEFLHRVLKDFQLLVEPGGFVSLIKCHP